MKGRTSFLCFWVTPPWCNWSVWSRGGRIPLTELGESTCGIDNFYSFDRRCSDVEWGNSTVTPLLWPLTTSNVENSYRTDLSLWYTEGCICLNSDPWDIFETRILWLLYHLSWSLTHRFWILKSIVFSWAQIMADWGLQVLLVRNGARRWKVENTLKSVMPMALPAFQGLEEELGGKRLYSVRTFW